MSDEAKPKIKQDMVKIYRIKDLVNTLENFRIHLVAYSFSAEFMSKRNKTELERNLQLIYEYINASWEFVYVIIKREKVDRVKTAKSAYSFLNKSDFILKASKKLIEANHDKKIMSFFNQYLENYEKIITRVTDLLIAEGFKVSNLYKDDKSVLKLSSFDYIIKCSLCNRTAGEFIVQNSGFNLPVGIIYNGVFYNRTYSPRHYSSLIKLLDEGDLGKIDDFFRTQLGETGLDCFCRECNTSYCSQHFTISPIDSKNTGSSDKKIQIKQRNAINARANNKTTKKGAKGIEAVKERMTLYRVVRSSYMNRFKDNLIRVCPLEHKKYL